VRSSWLIHFAHAWGRLPRWVRRRLLWVLNAHFIVGAVAVIRDDEGRVLLARHTYRSAPWGLPGGWVKRHEDPAEAVAREIFEETGLRVQVLGALAIQHEAAAHLTLVYAARITGGAFRPSAEVSEVRFVTPGAWPEGMYEPHRPIIEAACGPTA